MRQILIIDDHPTVAKMIQRNLEKSGFDVVTSSDPFAAVEMVKNQDIDLVIVDHMMPGMNGLEALAHIKEQSDDPPPVMMMTAFSSLQLAVMFVRRGGADFIERHNLYALKQ